MLLKKIAYSLFVMLGVIILVFSLFNASAGGAAMDALGQRSDKASQQALEIEFGLNQPFSERLTTYINDLSPISIHDDDKINSEKYNWAKMFGIGGNAIVLKFPYLRRSFASKKPVGEILLPAIKCTAILASAAILLAIFGGIYLGIICALKQNTWVDKLLLTITNLGVSIPSFFAAVLIAWLFGYFWSSYTGLSMTGSLYDYDFETGRHIVWANLILPAITLGIRPLSVITQLTRNSMLDVMSMDYVRTARAKGLSEYRVLVYHALRNALNPVLTAVSGWFASLMAGAFFVEYVFNYRGLGMVTVDALEKNDLPVVMGAVVTVAFLFVIINLLVDVLYARLDPRLR